MGQELTSLGAKLSAEKVTQLLDHAFRTNIESGGREQRGTPLCIWGLHGVGKTAVVRDFAERRGYRLAYCAPAQFEEMGDLHGLPRHDVAPDGSPMTVYAPPAWVPREPGPGILLLDDINRADDRILRGLMQLLQRGELLSWGLPPNWMIVCTANPEGGDYSITPMDDAMLTRMLHVTMVFDIKAWALWAHQHGVDPRGIAFALTYPELISGRGTSARSLTQFFELIAPIKDLRAHREIVHAVGMGALDEVTATTFITFIEDGLTKLVDPEDILEDRNGAFDRIRDLARGESGVRRTDRLATMCTRLFLHLSSERYTPDASHEANLVRFLMLTLLPSDLRLTLHRDLIAKGGSAVRRMLRRPELADLVVGSL